MVDFVAQVEIELTMEEIAKFNDLASKLELSLPDTVRKCMNERCDSLLDRFKKRNGKPRSPIKGSGKRTSRKDVPNPSNKDGVVQKARRPARRRLQGSNTT